MLHVNKNIKCKRYLWNIPLCRTDFD